MPDMGSVSGPPASQAASLMTEELYIYVAKTNRAADLRLCFHMICKAGYLNDSPKMWNVGGSSCELSEYYSNKNMKMSYLLTY